MNEVKVRTQYNRLAERYDIRWHSYLNHTLVFLHNWTHIESQAKILDVACGTGEFIKILLAENSAQKITGIDIAEEMLTIAAQKCQAYPDVEFYQASVLALPLSDRTFDVVVCANAFHYFNNPQMALAEMRRVLQPNGKIIIIDWNKDYLPCRMLHWILKITDPAHRQCYTQRQLHQLLTMAQFDLERTAKIRFGIAWELMAVTATSSLDIVES